MGSPSFINAAQLKLNVSSNMAQSMIHWLTVRCEPVRTACKRRLLKRAVLLSAKRESVIYLRRKFDDQLLFLLGRAQHQVESATVVSVSSCEESPTSFGYLKREACTLQASQSWSWDCAKVSQTGWGNRWTKKARVIAPLLHVVFATVLFDCNKGKNVNGLLTHLRNTKRGRRQVFIRDRFFCMRCTGQMLHAALITMGLPFQPTGTSKNVQRSKLLKRVSATSVCAWAVAVRFIEEQASPEKLAPVRIKYQLTPAHAICRCVLHALFQTDLLQASLWSQPSRQTFRTSNSTSLPDIHPVYMYFPPVVSFSSRNVELQTCCRTCWYFDIWNEAPQVHTVLVDWFL